MKSGEVNTAWNRGSATSTWTGRGRDTKNTLASMSMQHVTSCWRCWRPDLEVVLAVLRRLLALLQLPPPLLGALVLPLHDLLVVEVFACGGGGAVVLHQQGQLRLHAHGPREGVVNTPPSGDQNAHTDLLSLPLLFLLRRPLLLFLLLLLLLLFLLHACELLGEERVAEVDVCGQLVVAQLLAVLRRTSP